MVLAKLPPVVAPASAIALPSAGVKASPFTVVIDTREGAPFSFHNIPALPESQNKVLAVTIRRRCLATGDYSVEGYTDRVCVERKSLADLYGSLGGKGGHRRELFEAEHQRMQGIQLWGGIAAVVIESSIHEAMTEPPNFASGVSPNSVLGTALAWQSKYGIPWIWAGSRLWAEVTTYRLLDLAWRQFVRQDAKQKEISNGTRNDGT